MADQTLTPVLDRPVPDLPLRDHINVVEGRAPVPSADPTPPAPAAAPPQPAPVVDEGAAQAEADSPKPDAELSEAGRKLRENRADKRAARIREDNDNLARELQRRQELRSEIERLATVPSPTAGGRPAGTTPAIAAGSEPSLEAFQQHILSQDPNHPDPYAAAIEARTIWRINAQRAAEDAARVHAEKSEQLEARAKAAAEKYADFHAVVDPVITALRGTPRGQTVADFVNASEHGGDVLYRLGTNREAMQAIRSAASPVDVIRQLVQLETAITAPPKATPPPITQAPPPPSQTVGGAAPAADPDIRAGVSLTDHIRIANAQEAEARARGVRY